MPALSRNSTGGLFLRAFRRICGLFDSVRFTRLPNRPRPEVGGGRRPVKRAGQTNALNCRIDGLLATFSLGGSILIELPGCREHPQIGVDFHKFLLRANMSTCPGMRPGELNYSQC